MTETFGQKVKKARLEKRISLRKFAEEVDVSPTFISKMEHGEFNPPSEEKIAKISKVLELNFDTLMGLANKVPMDIQQKICENPEVFLSFLRRAKAENLKEINATFDSNFEKEDDKRCK